MLGLLGFGNYVFIGLNSKFVCILLIRFSFVIPLDNEDNRVNL